MIIIFRKSQQPLFDTVVEVKGHTNKQGHYVAPHMARRRKAAPPAGMAPGRTPQPSLFGRNNPDFEASKPVEPARKKVPAKLSAAIENMGGHAEMLRELAGATDGQRAKMAHLLSVMGKMPEAEVMGWLQDEAGHGGGTDAQPNLFEAPVVDPGEPVADSPKPEPVKPDDGGEESGFGFGEAVQAVEAAPAAVAQEAPAEAPAEAEPEAPAGGVIAELAKLPRVVHTTKAGKDLVGVIAMGMTKEQAQEIDPYTWKKSGGYFIREKHLTGAGPAAAPVGSKPTVGPQDGERNADGLIFRDGRWHRDEEAERLEGQKAAEASAAEESKRVAKRQAQAAKMREAGQKLLEQARADQSRDRQSNTARRARMAASADADARKREALAGTMINLAGAIESGEAKHLGGVTSRAGVEELERALHSGMAEAERHLPYADRERNKGRPPEDSDIRAAKMPYTTGIDGWRDKLLRDAAGKKGAPALAKMIRNGGALTPDVINGAIKVLGKDGAQNALGWHAVEVAARVGRLERMGIKTDNDLRLALTEFVMYRDGAKKEDPIKAAERALVGQKVGVDFFPTPKPLAAAMAERAGIKPGDKVLEPSAGNGHLADAAKAAGADVDTVEVSDTLRNILSAKGHNLAGRDFTEFEPGEKYDAVLMNPPFSDRQDAAHIMRAWDMVKPGGRMVAIAGEGVFFGQDSKAKAFREWLDEHGAEVEKLPDNTFKGNDLPAQTGAGARLIVLEKPEEVVSAGSVHVDDLAAAAERAREADTAAAQTDESTEVADSGRKDGDPYALDGLSMADLKKRFAAAPEYLPLPTDYAVKQVDEAGVFGFGGGKVWKVVAGGGEAMSPGFATKKKAEEHMSGLVGDANPERQAILDKMVELAQATGPKEGDRNAEGLVFRDGRWHRDEVGAAAEGADDEEVPPIPGDLPGAEWARGKGLIRGHYGVKIDGDVVGGYKPTPEEAIEAARAELATKAGFKEAADRRKAQLSALRGRLEAGGDATAGDLALLGLRAGGADLRWFIPAAAELFGISSRAVRPKVADLIRVGTNDMGTKRELVDPVKALRAMTGKPDAVPNSSEAGQPEKLEKLRAWVDERGGRDTVRAIMGQSKEKADELIGKLAEATGASKDEVAAEFGLKRKESKPAAPKAERSPRADTGDADDHGSENYRYADTGHIAGSRKEAAAAQVIARAKKDGAQVLSTGIDWVALEENPREAKELIKKSNLFGEVPWAALRDGGMEPGAGFLVDRIYAAIGQEPSEDSAQARRDYTLGLQTLRTRLEACKTADNVAAVLDDLRAEFDGKVLSAEEADAYRKAGQVGQEAWNRGREIEAERKPLYDAMNAANAAVSNAEYANEKRIRRGWAPDPKVTDSLPGLKAAADAASQAWRAHLEAHRGEEAKLHELRIATHHEREAINLKAYARNKLENPLHRAWNIMGDRFIGVLRYRSSKGSDAFMGHVAAAKMGKVKDWSWQEKEVTRAPRVTKESARFQLSVADSHERIGGRDVKPDSTKELKDMFGLRDVQSGNWVLRDLASAKFHTENCAAALADLADLMGADDSHVAMNGRLAMAFGARGQGAKGFKDTAPRAHYEAVHRVINITKMAGGGTLAHEWFHALDNMIKEAEGGGTSGAGDFVTENPNLLPPGELRDAVVGLRSAMLDGTVQAKKVMKYTAKDYATAQHNLVGRSYMPQIARDIVSAGDVHKAVAAIDRTLSGRFQSPKTKKQINDWTRIAAAYYGGNPAGGEVAVRAGPTMSNFAAGAADLDQGGAEYWAQTKEMAARAFQSWTEDRLAEMGRKNDYLSNRADNKFHIDPLFGIAWKPFPEGEERIRINKAFDRLIAAMGRSRTLEKALLIR